MSNNHLLQNNIMKKLFFSLVENQKWNTLIELIEEQQLNINYRDNKDRNALYWAIHQSNTKVIDKLLKLGINKNVTPNLSALNYAVYRDNIKVIKCLKNNGFSLDETDEINSTAMIYAVLYNKTHSIDYLFKNGVDIYHENFLGNSAFNLANDLKIDYLITKFNSIKRNP